MEEVETSSFTTASGHVNVAAPTAQHPGGGEEEMVMAAAEVSAAVQVAGHHIKLRYKSCKGKKYNVSFYVLFFNILLKHLQMLCHLINMFFRNCNKC